MQGRGISVVAMASPLRKLAHSTTAPVREFFNWHFEMVKQEVRRTATSGGSAADDFAAWEQVAELENAMAEMSLYQSRMLTRLGSHVEAMSERLAELERVVAQLAAVAAARSDEP